VPEPDPETSFKANFSCHVLFKHLRGEVEQQMGGLEDLEVCPADDCEYNIVQLKVRARSQRFESNLRVFLVKHIDELSI